MSDIYFTSDLHAFHKNIMKFCPATRHGDNVSEMTSILLDQINKTVKPGDTLYNLGDVSFGSAAQTEGFLGAIACRNHHLVYGNHDQVIRKSPKLQSLFASVQTELTITHRKVEIYMHHFPHRSWDKSHYGAFHLYGHHHGALEDEPWGRSMDVGIDARPFGDMKVWHIDEVFQILGAREPLGKFSD
ncbi:phosphoesterase [Acidovorax phage ACP17]|uniref:Phosphohydrolase n=1 Tax=Acidovorax phage ACP17 TaxID=2010329 RepID=A0A218M398_9CAUD|nr:phosphoesterase [Acidovorax phage ACP17]ASD50509.1 phosphohydrolase [Acidovorax phage ACP17]